MAGLSTISTWIAGSSAVFARDTFFGENRSYYLPFSTLKMVSGTTYFGRIEVVRILLHDIHFFACCLGVAPHAGLEQGV